MIQKQGIDLASSSPDTNTESLKAAITEEKHYEIKDSSTDSSDIL